MFENFLLPPVLENDEEASLFVKVELPDEPEDDDEILEFKWQNKSDSKTQQVSIGIKSSSTNAVCARFLQQSSIWIVSETDKFLRYRVEASKIICDFCRGLQLAEQYEKDPLIKLVEQLQEHIEETSRIMQVRI